MERRREAASKKESVELRMSGLAIPLSKIGPVQIEDVTRSGAEIYDTYARTCTVLQGDPPISDIGDVVPWVLTKQYGFTWQHWNRHFIVQVAGCPFQCPYCYVDNLALNSVVSLQEMVDWYKDFREQVPNLNVFHLMGGCPGAYAHSWPLLRKELDKAGFVDTVLLTDVLLVEELVSGVKPWYHIPDRTLVSVCIKGTSSENFKANTGELMYYEAMEELQHYIGLQCVHFTLIEHEPECLAYFEKYIGKERLSVLTVKEYEVVTWRGEWKGLSEQKEESSEEEQT